MRPLQSEAEYLVKRIECVCSVTPYDHVKQCASKLHTCDTLKYMAWWQNVCVKCRPITTVRTHGDTHLYRKVTLLCKSCWRDARKRWNIIVCSAKDSGANTWYAVLNLLLSLNAKWLVKNLQKHRLCCTCERGFLPVNSINQSINQSINFIDKRVKTTTDIVTKINTNYTTIIQIQQ